MKRVVRELTKTKLIKKLAIGAMAIIAMGLVDSEGDDEIGGGTVVNEDGRIFVGLKDKKVNEETLRGWKEKGYFDRTTVHTED